MRRRTISLLVLASLLLAGCGISGADPTTAPSSATEGPVATEELAATEKPASTEQAYAEARGQMVEIVRNFGVGDERVLEALQQVPRHQFVPDQYLSQAYANHPLPIGFGQTISQPYIVALMTAELGVEAGDKVLEVGTGSGYQAAVVAELGTEVYSLEIIGELAERAKAQLDALGYDNVHTQHADGYFGWPEQAPFDGILVTAAPDHVPQPLINQLAVGATLVIPVGPTGGYQELWKITRTSEDQTERISLGGVRFVPLTREAQN